MSKRADFYVKGVERTGKPYHYTASGLDNIFLRNGFTIEKTPYGRMVHIDDVHGLHHAISLYIIEQDELINGAEFRFLRKQMGLTQRELARLMSVSEQTVANYEKGKTSDLGPADPLMRLMFLVHIVPEETRATILKAAAGQLGAKLPEVPRRMLVQKWQEESKKAA